MDDLDDLLGPKPLPDELAGLRSAVLVDAARVLSRRRWFVRGGRVVMLAACYAAGLGSMGYWSRTVPPAPSEIIERQAPGQPPSFIPSADPYRNDPPERIEKWAFAQSGEKRAELYRRAGDGYLLRDDVQAALRCYRRALDAGSAEDLSIRADKDTWLLMSLKMARQKERSDARVN